MKAAKVLLAILGLDQHEVGALAVGQLLRNAGMEVVYAGRFNQPSSVARAAIEEDVDVIGISCHSWEYLYYTDELLGLLREQRAPIAVVVGGSVVTPKDAIQLKAKGVAAAFGPTTTPSEMIATISALAARNQSPA